MSETLWRGIIIALSGAVILITLWCLTHGITTIFMHLYYFPIVLLAYRYRWKGFGLALLLSLAYLVLSIVFDTGQADVLLGAFYRFLIFAGIAAVVAYLSGRISLETRSAQESAEIRERYLSLAPAIILVLDRNGEITYLNNKGGEILECTPEDVIGKSWFDQFLPEEDREPVHQVFTQLMAGQAEPERVFENAVLTCGGTKKIIRWYNAVLHDESGAITGTLAFGEDETDEKQVQDTLREMQQFQESVIANANVWISVLARNGTLLVWNNAAETISGYKKGEVLGKNTVWKQLYPDTEYREKVTGEIQRIIRRDTLLENFETEIRCADGTKKTIVWNTRGQRDDRGIVTSYIAIGRDVSAQKAAELRAGESSRFLAAMIDTLPVPIFFKDTSGRYLGCNPPFEEYIGIQREQIVGKSVYDLSPEDLADKYAVADRQLFDNPVPQRYETQVQYADGSRHDVIFFKAPFFNKDGTLGGLIGTFLDITERKRVEDALQESEIFNRGLVENLPEYLCVYGPDGRILYVNPASAKALGYDAETLVGTHIISYIAEECREKAKTKMAARKTGDNSSYEIDLVSKAGQRRSVIVKATPIKYRNNPAILLLLLDITDSKQAQEELRKSEEKFRIIADYTFGWEYWIVPDGTYVYMSPSCERITGYSPNEFYQKPSLFSDIIHPDDMPLYIEHMDLSSVSTGPESVEYRIVRKDGAIRWISHICQPMFDSNGKLLGRRSSNRDDTERKEAEIALRENEEKYRAFFTTSRDCVFITSLDGSWVDFNDTAVELFGYENRKDLLKIKVSGVYANPAERDAHIRYIRENGYSFEYPVDLKKKDGTIINALITTVARKDAAGNIIGFQGSIRDITERKVIQDRIQKLLRLQEEQVRIINTSPAIAFLWRAEENWPVETVSSNISYFGYSVDDFVSGRVVYSSIIHPDDLGQVAAEVESNSENHIDDFRQMYRIFGKDGSEYWIDDFTHIRRDNEGTITHYEGLILDITGRRQAEDALALEKLRMESLLSLSLMGQEADPEIIAEVVEDAIRLTGSTIGYLATLNEDESVMTMQYWSKSAHESCNIIDKPLVYPVEKTGLWGEAVRQRKPTVTNDYAADSPFKHGTPDGHVPLVRHMNIPVFDGDHIVAIAGVGNKNVDYDEGDIRQLQLLMQGWWQVTIRKRAEEAIVRSEERYRTLAEASPDQIFINDRIGTILYANTTALKLFGLSYDQIVGKQRKDLFPPELVREQDATYEKVFVSGEPVRKEARIRFGEQEQWIDTNLVPLKDAAGQVTAVLGVARDITGRKQMEAALRESRQLFSDIISFLPDPTFVIDKNGNVLAWNRALEQFSGVPAGAVIGKGDYEYSLWTYGKRRPILIDLVLHPDQDLGRQNFTDIRWEGRSVTAQTTITLPGSDHETPVSLVASPLLDLQGTVTGAIESMRDISGIKEAEAALARLNANLEKIVRERTRKLEEEVVQRMQAEKDVQAALDYTRSVIEANPDLVVVLDEAGIILDVNGAGETLTGFSKEQLVGTPYFGYLVEDGTVQSAFAGLLHEGKIENFVRIRRADGHATPLSVHATVVRGWEGDKVRIIVSAHDITRQKQDEEAIRSSRQMLSNVVENFPGVIFWKDRNSMYLGCNKNFSDGAGLNGPEEIIGKTDFDLPWAKTDAESYRSFDREVMDEGKPRLNIIETQLQNDGRIVWFDTSKIPLFGPDGMVIGILGASHDITRQKHDEEAIRASLDEKVILLREIHHRVKNNLQIIISLVNLQMRQTDDPGVKQIMAETQNRVRAMSLVHEKLYRSVSLSRIDFADYIRFLATQLFSFYGTDTRRVRLDLVMGKIMVDINTAVPLGLLVNELISNALKHAFPNSREGIISISGSEENNLISLVIRDNGVGMPKDLDWKNTSSLGMRLVTSLVDQVDGTITLDRENGTAYTITLRLNPASGGTG
ncbi:MAG: PAS domain S-box protein [Methanoregula sp.]|nr:PAS domain S-box protein [Methanoregula sp.]